MIHGVLAAPLLLVHFTFMTFVAAGGLTVLRICRRVFRRAPVLPAFMLVAVLIFGF